jgi:hypothetical protein
MGPKRPLEPRHVELGQVVATPGALAALTRSDIVRALGRHVRGDWGEVCAEDWAANEASLKCGARLFSVYTGAVRADGSAGEKFWVITEADRSATTVLLPDEY